MAIAFARPEYVSRSNGANACCKSAYNARTKIKDDQSNVTYNFSRKDDNVHHAILLPTFVNQKFKNPIVFANEVEKSERRKDSQLYVEWVLALPKDENVSLSLKQEMVYEFIKRKNWIGEGLGVQLDIHSPHEGEVNWHAHLLVTTRRFLHGELGLDPKKAIDLQPDVRFGKVQKTLDIDNNVFWRDVQNDLFKAHGLSNRVDLNGEVTQEHIGPMRMRSSINQKQMRNYERQIANIESLNSGDRVLDRITNHTSVFNESDIRRAVSCVSSSDIARILFQEALSSRELEFLYDESGNSTGFYTTKEVRAEELKLLRLADYVAAQKNVIESVIEDRKGLQSLLTKAIKKSDSSLSHEQQDALSYLLLGTSGMRTLRGRAGTGKSFVLTLVAEIATDLNINVIGLAPTHKARIDLANNGYAQNDTIKGMLFKLHNGKFNLPKRSLIVVDEAGMIGNDDYLELLRVAAKQRCNVISSGDEKQLTSVQRGGMFEVFAEKYDSKLLFDIKRQNSEWGRDVANAFANGEVATGVNILQRENRIVQSLNFDASMGSLLNDWNVSSEPLSNKLILAVKNVDVDLLNSKVRGYLKTNKTLSGTEFAISGKNYMQGERILITQTSKDLGLTNGDLAEIIYASKEKFTIKISNTTATKEISFNPSKYQGFSHGYATTVFKSQGSSINDVFVFHDGFAGLRNSYVALSRNIKELKLYTNQFSTKNLNHLIKQLSNDHEISSSLNYFTKSDLAKKEQSLNHTQEKGIFSSRLAHVANLTYKKLTEVADKHFELASYYNYEQPKITNEQIEIVLDSYIGNEEYTMHQEAMMETEVAEEANAKVLMVASGNKPRTQAFAAKTKQSPKERFYNNADRARSKTSHQNQKEEWAREYEHLKSEVKFKAELIAQDILGNPNKRLSNSKTLRFGDNGKIAVRINGEASGQWYDFSASKGGDLFTLVQEHKHCDFVDASDYLRSITGITSNPHLKLVYDHQNSELTKKHIEDKRQFDQCEKAKQLLVSKLHSRSKEIHDQSVARHYLKKRSITCSLSKDTKTTGIYQKEQNKYYPAIVAFARNSQGNITGGQQILLDKLSSAKADIDTPKKSFGKIAGSFVNVGGITIPASTSKQQSSLTPELQPTPHITIIAEGLETALSVKQALAANHKLNYLQDENISIKVLCSLGISNISNYPAAQNEKIIIAADNDGQHSNTSKTIESATKTLQEKGAFVEIVTSEHIGDFNDDLQRSGEKPIQLAFIGAINKHSSKTLEQFFASHTSQIDNQSNTQTKTINDYLSKQELEDLKYIQKYDLPETHIVDAYRKDPLKGLFALEHSRKALGLSIHAYEQNHSLIQEAKRWSYVETQETKINIIKSLVGKDEALVQNHFQELRNGTLTSYLSKKLQEINKQKEMATDLPSTKAAIQNEQTLLKDTFESLKSPIEEYGSQNKSLLQYGEFVAKHPELIQETFTIADTLVRFNPQSEALVLQTLKTTTDIQMVHTSLDKAIDAHTIGSNLKAFSQEKQNAETPQKVMVILAKEQDYLAGLKGNMKYHYHDKELMSSIHNACAQKETNTIDQLYKTAHYAFKQKILSEDKLMDHLKSNNDLSTMHQDISKICYTHHCGILNDHCNKLAEGISVHHDGHQFDCVTKYLEHWKDHVDHKLLPMEQINHALQQELDHHHDMDHSHHMDL